MHNSPLSPVIYYPHNNSNSNVIFFPQISENIGVLDVLLVVMRYSETAVLPCLYEIVDNVHTIIYNLTL